MVKKGWHRESARHSLAARGLKTTVVNRRYPVKATSDKFDLENLEDTLYKIGNEAAMDFIHHEDDIFNGWDKITREHIYKFEGMLEGIYDGYNTEADQNKVKELIFKEAEKINDFRETVGLGRIKIMFASTRAEMEAEDEAERAMDRYRQF